MDRTTNMKKLLISFFVCLLSQLIKVESASQECSTTEFHCSNGKCIPLSYVCDRGNDCGDRSDEELCVPFACPPYTFQCLNGNCITSAWICDGSDHCGDRSDEENCVPFACSNRFAFQCSNGKCIGRIHFCDSLNHCGDRSDEGYCDVTDPALCPRGWTLCPSGRRCIPGHWVCNGYPDCPDGSEERNCGNQTAKTPGDSAAKAELKSRILSRRKPISGSDRWGSQVHRIAVALHLSDNTTFGTGQGVGEEIRFELITQLLRRLGKDRRLSSQELALYIHALLLSCMDPKDFYGDNLVQELRRRVEASGNYTNPFLILVLCNAGDVMTDRDVERVTTAYDSQHRPFWTDYQALSCMALSCISSRSSVSVDERVLKDMLQELKRRQFRNGTVDNYRTTALVTQALFIHESYEKDFDLDSALKVLRDDVNKSRSLLDAYYALPVFHRKSLLNVTSDHCRKEPEAEEEALQKTLDLVEETMSVQYSVWMGDEVNLARTWRLRVRVNNTVYDALETVAKIDNRQRVEYNVVDGKPFVSALNGKEDDPELGMLWFLYLNTPGSDKDPKMVEQSPVDVVLKPNQEIVLWYKRGPWSEKNPMTKSETSL